MSEKRFGGITRKWLLSIGGYEEDGEIQFSSAVDEFGHFGFVVIPNETGSATVRGWHFPERNGGGENLKDQHVATRQKLLDLFKVMRVKCRPS